MPIPVLYSRYQRPVLVLRLWSAASVSSTSATFTASLLVEPLHACHGFIEQPLAFLGVNCLFPIQRYEDEHSLMSGGDDLNDPQDGSSNSPGPMLSNCSPNSPSSRRHQFYPHSNPHAPSLQFPVIPHFIQFVQKVLKTTQISQSVIVLSLYIYQLKEQNQLMNSLPGSEFRVVIPALMMANEFVDDNTYTNKTWFDAPGTPLEEVNKIEREILLVVNFSLYVNKTTYDSWLNLLKGLVLTKEKDRSVQKKNSYSRGRPTQSARAPVQSNTWSIGRSTATYATPTRPHCARSTLPSSQSFQYPFTLMTQATSRPTLGAWSRTFRTGPSSTAFPPIKAPRHITIPGSISLNDRMWVSSSGQLVPQKTMSAIWSLWEKERSWAAL